MVYMYNIYINYTVGYTIRFWHNKRFEITILITIFMPANYFVFCVCFRVGSFCYFRGLFSFVSLWLDDKQTTHIPFRNKSFDWKQKKCKYKHNLFLLH